MKLKKFYEYVNQIKELTLDDLSMYLRKGDRVRIESSDGIKSYRVNDIDELGMRVSTIGDGPKVQIDFDFEYLNSDDNIYGWKLLAINDDEISINEKKSQ